MLFKVCQIIWSKWKIKKDLLTYGRIFRFPIGSIDQLEDALRRVQDQNEVPYENRIAIQYKTTTRPFSILANNVFIVAIAGFILYQRAKKGSVGMGMGPQGPPPPGGKGVKGMITSSILF